MHARIPLGPTGEKIDFRLQELVNSKQLDDMYGECFDHIPNEQNM